MINTKTSSFYPAVFANMKIFDLSRQTLYVACLLLSASATAYAEKVSGVGAQQTSPDAAPTAEYACAVTQPSQVTGIVLLPSDSVVPGTNVTVKVEGYGCCYVVIETNGASDIDGGVMGDYDLGFGSFPRSQTFSANKMGNFKIAVLAADLSKESCIEGDALGINTTLHVGYKKIPPKELIPEKQLPVIPETQPNLAPRNR